MTLKTLASVSTIALVAAGAATAGGFDRSGQGVGVIFEEGTYGEFSIGHVMPDISGVGPAFSPTTGTPNGNIATSGNIGVDYTQVGLGFKTDISDKFSVALIVDQPFGADVSYANAQANASGVYPFLGASASVESTSLTLLGQYNFAERMAVHGGLRYTTVSGQVRSIPSSLLPPGSTYNANYGSDSDVGFVLGASYEIPEIALRVALTYSSETEVSLPVTVGLSPAAIGIPSGNMNVKLPQSVNLDFQTGVAANTLVFGSIRWAEWTVTSIDTPAPGGVGPTTNLASHSDDVFTYSLGVGRKFSDQWSAAVTLGYEKSNGGLAGNLAPTDGYKSIGVGATYTMDNMKITGGVRYVDIGDATTSTIGAQFKDNSAVAVGLKVGVSF